jgi:hypothetical protein
MQSWVHTGASLAGHGNQFSRHMRERTAGGVVMHGLIPVASGGGWLQRGRRQAYRIQDHRTDDDAIN